MSEFYCPNCGQHKPLEQRSKRRHGPHWCCKSCAERITALVKARREGRSR